MMNYLAGCGFGMLYFWGLWRTIKGLSGALNPISRVRVSFALRMAIFTFAACLVRPSGLPFFLLGFLTVRTIWVKRWS